MNEDQMRAVQAIDDYFKSGNSVPVSRATIKREEWEHAKAALASQANSVPTLSHDEFAALYRCDQTMINDNSYDIDATMMKKLADYGAVWHKGGGYYAITKFGNYLLKTKNGAITSALSSQSAKSVSDGSFMDLEDSDYVAKRFRLILSKLGISTPESDEELLLRAFSYLGMARRALEDIFTAPQPPTDDRVRELEKDAAIGKLVRSKLISCNDVPVSRCHISADEVQAIDQAMNEANK